MAIRWSAKGKRFYDDSTGYPVAKTTAVKSSIARAEYAHARPAHPYILHPEIFVPKEKRAAIPEGYEVRPLEREFEEEYEAYDGTIAREMSLEVYMDMIGESEPAVYDQEDRYSED